MLLVEQLLLAGVAAVLSLSLVTALPQILVARLPGLSERILHGTSPDWRVFVLPRRGGAAHSDRRRNGTGTPIVEPSHR
jgi:hypothetical protein